MGTDFIIVNGVRYVPAHTVETPIQIVILDRGWVVVGHVTCENGQIAVRDASVIRKWGTTNGLGEIALNGPTPDTKLDRCGDIFLNELCCVARMNTEQSKWQSKL